MLTRLTSHHHPPPLALDLPLAQARHRSVAGTFTYGYNGGSRQVHSLALPGSSQILETWDDAGDLLATTLTAGGVAVDAYGYGYDANGNRLSVSRVDHTAVNYAYDGVGELLSATAVEPNGVTPRANENFGYGYDGAGNLLARTQGGRI